MKYKKAHLDLKANDLNVWLSHDVDWIKKNIIQTAYYTLKEKRLYHLINMLSASNNYWNFEALQEIESKYGAKSTFFFLNESIQPKLTNWKSIELGYGRYSINEPKVTSKIKELDNEGWDVGMHGSYYSYNNFELLKQEKDILENIVGHEVLGTRQHHLNNQIPTTWEYHQKLGFKYDSSVGIKHQVGFDERFTCPFCPFENSFTVFPVVLMDSYLIGITKDIKEGEKIIVRLIEESIDKNTVLTVIWHHRTYNEKEFPQLYYWYNFLLSEVKNNNGKFVLPMDLMSNQ